MTPYTTYGPEYQAGGRKWRGSSALSGSWGGRYGASLAPPPRGTSLDTRLVREDDSLESHAHADLPEPPESAQPLGALDELDTAE